MDLDLPREIDLDVCKDLQIIVSVDYLWIPVKCTHCKVFRHLSYACDKKEERKWQPK